MYWNICIHIFFLSCLRINRNMRCIEIPDKLDRYRAESRLIETWDVLKWEMDRSGIDPEYLINRNMRCIEITSAPYIYTAQHTINRNMRCIEMEVDMRKIITVLAINRNMRCIEIRAKNRKGSRVSRINRNMRCIEI